jgi:hypothetical protein
MDKYIELDIDSKKTVACVVQKVEKLPLLKAEKHHQRQGDIVSPK